MIVSYRVDIPIPCGLITPVSNDYSIPQDQMMRKKVVHNLDSRQITMVENAYYYCNPPDRVAYVKVTCFNSFLK